MTWYFDKKIGAKGAQHIFAHFDEIVTLDTGGTWMAVCEPGSFTRIYDLDSPEELELVYAFPSKKSRGIFGTLKFEVN